jgi:hypothetical protein
MTTPEDPVTETTGRAPQPRCPECCEHGQPCKGYGYCLWCEDVASGHDAPIAPYDPQWLCPHGIGHDYSRGGSPS